MGRPGRFAVGDGSSEWDVRSQRRTNEEERWFNVSKALQ